MERTPQQKRAIQILVQAGSELTGRGLADALGVSPTTANVLLATLEKLGDVNRRQDGRSIRWSASPNAVSAMVHSTDRATRSVLIATALPLEASAMRRFLVEPVVYRSGNGTSVLRAQLVGDNVTWDVSLVQLGMGNTTAAVNLSNLIVELGVDLTAFMGVAAGLKPADDDLGDVIFCTRAYNGGAGKEASTGDGGSIRLGRPLSYQVTHRLEQLAISVISNSDWDSTSSSRAHARARLGAVVSVEAVQAAPTSDQMTIVARMYNDAIALDMETYGAYAAAHLHGIPVFAVRGISDFVEGKSASSDSSSQPRAARNAAHLLVDVLVAAAADDIPPRGMAGGPSVNPTNSPGHGSDLPPNVLPWLNALTAEAPDAENEFIAEVDRMRSTSVSPATWLSKLLHRPPEWVRSDPTGYAWATLAQFVDALQLPRSNEAYGRAAECAIRVGDHPLAEVLQVRALLADHPLEAHRERVTEGLAQLAFEASSPLEPFLKFYRAAFALDHLAMEALAPFVLASFGLMPERVGLEPVEVPAVALPEAIQSQLGSAVLLSLSGAWLLQGEITKSLRASEYAIEVVPNATSGLLLNAQGRLARVLDEMTRPRGADVSGSLRGIEVDALRVREARQLWGGPTAEPLSVAARARAQGGDPMGALRMLRAAPNGTASVQEANDSQVLKVTALAALLAGDNDLAATVAASIPSDTDMQMLRASALLRLPGMTDEAKAAFHAALEAASNVDEATSALLGLAQAGAINVDEDLTASWIKRIDDVDHERAELILASSELRAGHSNEALRRSRAVRGSVLATEIMADALIKLGRASDAVDVLHDAGVTRGDVSLRAQALIVAGQHELDSKVDEISKRLMIDGDREAQVLAKRAQLQVARRGRDWRAAVALSEQLIADPGQGADSGSVDEYRWGLVEAQFHLEEFDRAWAAMSTPPLAIVRPEQALLLYAIVRGYSDRGSRVPDDLFEAVLTAASSFLDDEQVTAEAIKVILFAKPVHEPTDVQISKMRAVQDAYFERFPDAELKRIEVDPDDALVTLTDFLRNQFGPREAMLRDAADRAWIGQFPLAVLAEANSRSYAETLIKVVLGCHVSVGGPPQLMASQTKAASQALDELNVVADTSALVVGPKFGIGRPDLMALFDRVSLPVSLRADIAAARSSLASRSTATLGWNGREGRPVLTEIPADTANRWALDADALYDDLRHVVVVEAAAIAGDQELGVWNASLLLAKELGVPLWTDDVGTRVVASELGVAAFGTLDLIQEARRRGMFEALTEAQIFANCVAERIVDVRFNRSPSQLAREANWDPSSYAALQLSRPHLWSQATHAFSEYQKIIRSIPDHDPTRVAAWAANAGRGLCLAVPAGGRPGAVGALIAWTVLNSEPMLDPLQILQEQKIAATKAASLEQLLEVGAYLQEIYFDAGDIVTQIVETIVGALTSSLDPALAARYIAKALSTISEPYKARAMTAFLAAAPSPRE